MFRLIWTAFRKLRITVLFFRPFYRGFSTLMPTGILYPYPWLSSLLHLQGRCIPSRHERSLLAKERTIFRNLASKSVIFGRTRFFYMSQSWDMGQIILLPLRRKACCGFFLSEKSEGFGRERTRDLGYQRPACKALTILLLSVSELQ
jgi:hypothetical protein